MENKNEKEILKEEIRQKIAVLSLADLRFVYRLLLRLSE